MRARASASRSPRVSEVSGAERTRTSDSSRSVFRPAGHRSTSTDTSPAEPGRVVELVDLDRHLARVEVSGVRRVVNVGLVLPDGLEVGDWVLIHVGFALSKIDEEEARRTTRFLEQLGDLYEGELDEIERSRIE